MVKDSKKMYNYILEYLLNGFYGLGFDGAMQYIADNYLLAEGCESQNKEDYLKNKLANLKKYKIGNIVPDIHLENAVKTSVKSLYELTTNYKLVVFWASDCEHCEALLPALKTLYESKGVAEKLAVLAVSIDEKEEEWRAAISKNNYDVWLNSCDFKGWDGTAANDYHVYGTPMIFVLNKDHKIIARPSNEAELQAVFAQEGLIGE